VDDDAGQRIAGNRVVRGNLKKIKYQAHMIFGGDHMHYEFNLMSGCICSRHFASNY